MYYVKILMGWILADTQTDAPGSGIAPLQFLMFLLSHLYISVYFSALVFPSQDVFLTSSLELNTYDFLVEPKERKRFCCLIHRFK